MALENNECTAKTTEGLFQRAMLRVSFCMCTITENTSYRAEGTGPTPQLSLNLPTKEFYSLLIPQIRIHSASLNSSSTIYSLNNIGQ